LVNCIGSVHPQGDVDSPDCTEDHRQNRRAASGDVLRRILTR